MFFFDIKGREVKVREAINFLSFPQSLKGVTVLFHFVLKRNKSNLHRYFISTKHYSYYFIHTSFTFTFISLNVVFLFKLLLIRYIADVLQIILSVYVSGYNLFVCLSGFLREAAKKPFTSRQATVSNFLCCTACPRSYVHQYIVRILELVVSAVFRFLQQRPPLSLHLLSSRP